MSQDISLNAGLAGNKQSAAAALKPRQQQPVENDAVQGKKDKALSWGNDDKSGAANLTYIPDILNIGATTIVAPATAPKAAEVRQTLKNKFVDLLRQNEGNRYSHNRLVAKVADWLAGNLFEQLARLGLPASELAGLKTEVRGNLIEQNGLALSQVVYDETMLEVVG